MHTRTSRPLDENKILHTTLMPHSGISSFETPTATASYISNQLSSVAGRLSDTSYAVAEEVAAVDGGGGSFLEANEAVEGEPRGDRGRPAAQACVIEGAVRAWCSWCSCRASQRRSWRFSCMEQGMEEKRYVVSPGVGGVGGGGRGRRRDGRKCKRRRHGVGGVGAVRERGWRVRESRGRRRAWTPKQFNAEKREMGHQLDAWRKGGKGGRTRMA
ncbi:hypothetical protein NL676_029698 [Syzygium grande]|nr:hypothetical protein NL676_029698 [Syzygium grande]